MGCRVSGLGFGAEGLGLIWKVLFDFGILQHNSQGMRQLGLCRMFTGPVVVSRTMLVYFDLRVLAFGRRLKVVLIVGLRFKGSRSRRLMCLGFSVINNFISLLRHCLRRRKLFWFQGSLNPKPYS